MVGESLSRLTLNGNEETKQKSTYQNLIVFEINYTEELPEGTFTINLELIQRYQRDESIILTKY